MKNLKLVSSTNSSQKFRSLVGVVFFSIFLALPSFAQCDLTEVSVVSTTGEWGNEMSWTLYDDSENVVAFFQGESDYDTQSELLCLEDGCYLLHAQDSWGDGWNGGSVDLGYSDMVFAYELMDGTDAYYTFELNASDCYFEVSGCTNPEALNYLIGATVDDGSCILEYSFEYNKAERTYILYLPPGIESGAPLVFNFHGYTSSAEGQMFYSGMNDVAAENGFAVCYPQGLNDFFGIPHWNAGLTISEVDDLGFATALAEFLQTEHNLSPECTYACGMSNGGYMSYHLACHAPETFKAIASVTGTMSGSDWESCDPNNPVPVLEIHGTADDVVPYTGMETSTGGWGPTGSTPEVIDFWVAENECTGLETFDFPDTNPDDGMTVQADFHTGGVNGNEVWLYTVNGGGHIWPQPFNDIGASQHIWDFFSQFCGVANDVSENERVAVSVWPNPGKDEINIETSGSGLVSVFTLEGKLVKQLKITAGINRINLPSGVFLVHFEDENGMLSRKKLVVL